MLENCKSSSNKLSKNKKIRETQGMDHFPVSKVEKTPAEARFCKEHVERCPHPLFPENQFKILGMREILHLRRVGADEDDDGQVHTERLKQGDDSSPEFEGIDTSCYRCYSLISDL